MLLQDLYPAILLLLVVPAASASNRVPYGFDSGETGSNNKPEVPQEFDQNTVTVILSDTKIPVVDDFASSVVHDRRRNSPSPSTSSDVHDRRLNSPSPSTSSDLQDRQHNSPSPSTSSDLQDRQHNSPSPSTSSVVPDRLPNSPTPSASSDVHDRRHNSSSPSTSSVVHDQRSNSPNPSTNKETPNVPSTPVSRNNHQKIIIVNSFMDHTVQLVKGSCIHGFLGNPTWLSEHSSNFSLSEYIAKHPASQILLRWEENTTNSLAHNKEEYDGGLTGSEAVGLGALFATVATSLSRMYKIITQGRSRRMNGGLLLKKLFSMKSLKQRSLKRKLTILKSKRLHGGRGNSLVYKGSSADMLQVAVQKSHVADHYQTQEFLNEADNASNINSKYILNLLGVCLEGKDLMLVFEVVPNGTLSQHIHGISRMINSWWNRTRIATETAPTVYYKHSCAEQPTTAPFYALLRVRAPDIELSLEQLPRRWKNILLDGPHATKLSDYGTSELIPFDPTRISPEGRGMIWYVNPEYHQTRELRPKSDTYGFRGVLMELLSKQNRLPRRGSGKTTSLVNVFTTSLKNNRLDQVMKIPPTVAPLHARVRAPDNEASVEYWPRRWNNYRFKDHRDFKPSNMLLGGTLSAKVSDYGTSKFILPDHTPISKTIQQQNWFMDTYLNHCDHLVTIPCSYRFLDHPTRSSEISLSFSITDFRGQILLDWEEDITWEEAQDIENLNECICCSNTTCTNGLGYNYISEEGFDGNLFTLAEGQVNINNCEDPTKTTCEGTCENTPGSCTCDCPLDGGFGVLFATVITSPTWVNKEKKQELNHRKNGGLVLKKLNMTSLEQNDWRSQLTVLDIKPLHSRGNGWVYKGSEKDHNHIEQFLNEEAAIVSKINQKKVVKLLEKVLMLLYERVPNGTPSHHIHGKSRIVSSWRICLKVAAKTARALVYIHSYADQPTAHRDVKSRKMILDRTHTAKVSGFKAIGYMNPEYLQTGELTPRSEAYGFGTGLKELLSEPKQPVLSRFPQQP